MSRSVASAMLRASSIVASASLVCGCGMLVRAEAGAMKVAEGDLEAGMQATLGFTVISIAGVHVTPSAGGYLTPTTGGGLFNLELGVVAGGVDEHRGGQTQGVGGAVGGGITGGFGRVHYGFGRRTNVSVGRELGALGWNDVWRYFDISLMGQGGLNSPFPRDAVLGGVAWHLILHN